MRTSVLAAAAVLALALPVVLLDGTPARAASIFVETNPSTARPGDQVGVRASCTDNLSAATVSATAFGTVTVQPNFGFLTATTVVHGNTRPGDYPVKLTCPDKKTAISTLHVLAKVEPSQGPATGGGGTAPGRSAPMLIGGGLTAMAAGLVLAVSAVRRRRVS
jgi:hypothetical protein